MALAVDRTLPEFIEDVGEPLDAHGLRAWVVRVTPEIARTWLDRNIENRRTKNGKIQTYARDMSAGHWSLTGEAIIFDDEGILRNGQNRLHGCIGADTPFVTLVLVGVRRKAFANMDRGSARTIADVFGIEGVRNSAVVVAAGNYLWRYKRGRPLSGGGASTLTVDEAHELLDQHPRLGESVGPGVKCGQLAQCRSKALMTFLHYVLAEINRGEADAFFAALASGEGLRGGSPILALRNVLTGSRKLPPPTITAYVFKAWNAWRLDATIKQLRWSDSEALPTPR